MILAILGGFWLIVLSIIAVVAIACLLLMAWASPGSFSNWLSERRERRRLYELREEEERERQELVGIERKTKNIMGLSEFMPILQSRLAANSVKLSAIGIASHIENIIKNDSSLSCPYHSEDGKILIAEIDLPSWVAEITAKHYQARMRIILTVGLAIIAFYGIPMLLVYLIR